MKVFRKTVSCTVTRIVSSMADNLLANDGNEENGVNGYNALINDDEKATRSTYKNGMDDEDDLVIESEDEEEEDTLNLAGQNLTVLPTSVCKDKGGIITTLILTKNKLTSLKGLEYFQSLQTLQLDRNGLKNINDFPKLPQLKTLWLNNNNLKNLNCLLLMLKKQVFCEYANIHTTNTNINIICI